MSHDYDPEWDYELDRRPSKAVKELVDRYLVAHQPIFETLRFEKAPRVHYVKGLRGHLARYINGTRDEPVIVIDTKELLKGATKYKLDLPTAVEPTLLHEYGHAYMDHTGQHEEMSLEEEEGRVEEFAHTFWDTRDLDAAMEHLTGAAS